MEIVVPDEFKSLYEVSPLHPIVKIPHPALRSKAVPVARPTKKHRQLAERMIRAMTSADGIGLAAPQLGIQERLIVMAPIGTKPIVLVNPEIVKVEGSQIGEEGCLSIPALYGDVERGASATVRGQNLAGSRVEYVLEGLAARVAQHEVDHLDGVLFIDKVDITTLYWRNPRDPGPEAE